MESCCSEEMMWSVNETITVLFGVSKVKTGQNKGI